MSVMVILAAAALASLPPSSPVNVAAQATATIRVIRGVELKFGRDNPDAPPARECVLKTADGSAHRAKLIEFQ
jgi:type II secretory pathway pseudopilin PulG